MHTLAPVSAGLVGSPQEAIYAPPNACSICPVRNACLPAGLNGAALDAFEDLIKVKRRVLEGALLCRTGDRFSALFIVRSGTLKSTRHWQNAHRVMAFHLPADFVGLDAIESGAYVHDVWAMEDSEVCILPYAQLTALGHTSPAVSVRLIRLLSGSLSGYQHLMLTLGNMTADQRIAWFLMMLSARYQRLGYAGDRFVLRMRQGDIASYLGLTYETVSRVIAQLKRLRVIATSEGRWKYPDVELRDPDALRRIVSEPRDTRLA
jgi:CRP/FNR family transcriptional regulator